MKRTLSLLLVLCALLGILGQEVAFAIGPTFAPAMETAASMSKDMDCPEMAKMQQEKSKPCKGLTLACIAQMGCVLSITFKEPPAPVEMEPVASVPATWPPLPILIGREIVPDPEPPSQLS